MYTHFTSTLMAHCTSGAIRGSVSCSRTLRQGVELATFWLLTDFSTPCTTVARVVVCGGVWRRNCAGQFVAKTCATHWHFHQHNWAYSSTDYTNKPYSYHPKPSQWASAVFLCWRRKHEQGDTAQCFTVRAGCFHPSSFVHNGLRCDRHMALFTHSAELETCVWGPAKLFAILLSVFSLGGQQSFFKEIRRHLSEPFWRPCSVATMSASLYAGYLHTAVEWGRWPMLAVKWVSGTGKKCIQIQSVTTGDNCCTFHKHLTFKSGFT